MAPYRGSSAAEQLSSVASLTWNGKRVLFDTLSTPFSLVALVEKRSSTEESHIELFLTRKQRDTRETISFPEGRAHFIMARPHLRLHDGIPWKALSIFSSGKSKISYPLPQVVDWIEDIEENEELSSAFICDAQEEQRVSLEAEPLHIRTHLSPILQFHNMRGLSIRDDATLQCTEIEIEGLDKKKNWSDLLFFFRSNYAPFLASIAEEIVIVSGQKSIFIRKNETF
ncbi:hypothetical protein ACTFIW_012088 [Dictyostelium discoideum]